MRSRPWRTRSRSVPIRSGRGSSAGAPLALQIDAGYLRTPPQSDGRRWIPVVTSKVVRKGGGRDYAHAVALSLEARQDLRQQAFLQSVGIDRQSPVTVLSDGGDDISTTFEGTRSRRSGCFGTVARSNASQRLKLSGE